MNKYETMSESVIRHLNRRDYLHRKWVNGQENFKRIREQDCYGVQKRKGE